ncbi:phospholipase D-like domain-containing protein [Actinocorallia sp. B10E7]|uniref:phospholipase D-like domain-containing protein n=1 Tax=Actinocorallia sp. B10E7 TaxID=3153558 RepID=UPI00325E0672
MKGQRRLWSAVLAAVFALGTVVAVPQSASAARVKSQIIFNNPLDRQGAKRIENKIYNLVKGARAGSSIRVSIYQFTNATRIADELIAADRRGVDVRVLADTASTDRGATGGQPTGYERVLWALGPSKVTTCPKGRGCIGSNFNHTKFLLFSNTRGTKNVVVQSSQNLNATGGTTTDWNDAVVFADAGSTYTAYRKYFDDLWSRKVIPDYWKKRGGPNSSPYATIQFFPKADGDPVDNMLRNVRCSFTYKGRKGTTQVRIAMGSFSDKRDWLLRSLGALQRKGCQIEIIVTVVPTDASRTAVVVALRAAGIKVYDFSKYGSPNSMHSKYILVQGQIGKQVGKWTWTGSANLTWSSLRQDDEIIIQLKKVGSLGPWKIHDLYRCNFRRAKAQFLGKPMPCKG